VRKEVTEVEGATQGGKISSSVPIYSGSMQRGRGGGGEEGVFNSDSEGFMLLGRQSARERERSRERERELAFQEREIEIEIEREIEREREREIYKASPEQGRTPH
jgi:hypothetical protein